MAPREIIGLYSPVPQSGKSAFAEALCYYVPSSSVISFAKPIRDMLAPILDGWRGGKEDVVPHLGVTYRHLLNTLGTDWGRACVGMNTWLNIAVRRLSKADTDLVVFDDVRFENEFRFLSQAGATLVKIIRPGIEAVDTHECQGRLEGHEFDLTIENDGDIEDLRFKAQALSWKFEAPDTRCGEGTE